HGRVAVSYEVIDLTPVRCIAWSAMKMLWAALAVVTRRALRPVRSSGALHGFRCADTALAQRPLSARADRGLLLSVHEAGDGQSVTWSPTLRADLFLKFCRTCQKTLDYGPTESSRCRLIVQSGRSLCYPFSTC